MSSLLLVSSGLALAETEEELAARLKKSQGEGLLSKFRGSMASTSLYMGSGTFGADSGTFPGNAGPAAAYVSQDLLFYPRFTFAPRQSIRAYWIVECEYTDPDNATGRRCDPSDTRLSYNHTKLWQDPWIEGTFSGAVQLWVPTSYASQNNNTIMNLRLSGAYMAYFWKDRIEAMYGFSVQKYLPTSRFRSSPITKGKSWHSAEPDSGATGSRSPMNDNWVLVNNFHLGFYFTKQWSASVDFMIMNYFRYAVPENHLLGEGLPVAGRADLTYGIVDVSYQPLKWFSASFGVASMQNALTLDNKSIRFPFYDFIGPSNNSSKWYLSARFIY